MSRRRPCICCGDLHEAADHFCDDCVRCGCAYHGGACGKNAGGIVPVSQSGHMAPIASGVGWSLHCREALGFLVELPNASVDAVITDPPYSSGGMFRGDRTASTSKKYVGTDVELERPDFAGDTRDQRSFATWCALWMFQAYRVTKPGGVICVFSDWRQLPSTTDAIQAGGWIWRGVLVWDKTEAVRPQLGRFRAQAEYVVWGSSGVVPPRAEVGTLPGVLRCGRRAEDREHITGKPVPVMRELVRVCPPGGVVLDPFAGSGSTGVAALLEGREFLGCEITSEYFELAERRLRETESQRTPGAPLEQAGLFDKGGSTT